MSQYAEAVTKVCKYSTNHMKHCPDTLELPDGPIRKDANSSRYFAVTEKKHLVELVAAQTREHAEVNWQEVNSLLKYSKQKKSPMECLMQYRNDSNPAICKGAWFADEDKRLVRAADKHRLHDWCTIADEVGGGRTPLQCLHRFQTSLHKGLGVEEEWSAMELQLLEQAVQLYGMKSWQHVANCLPGRAAYQCSSRYRLLRQQKQSRLGRWEDEEERRLVLSVIAYGDPDSYKRSHAPSDDTRPATRGSDQDIGTVDEQHESEMVNHVPGRLMWRKISNHVPARGDGQCREKWVNVLDPLLLRNRFSPEEDAILLREVAKYITPSVSGADPSEPVNSGAVDGYTAPRAVKWNLIAAQLGNLRTDCQVARRWRELSGDHMAAKYKETSRKRRAIAPADYNRPGGGKCKSRQRGVDVLDDREFEPTVLVTAAQELLEVRQEEQSAEDEGTSTVPIAEL